MGGQRTITVNDGAIVNDVDLGNVQLASLTGFKFLDENQDGDYDVGVDSPLEGITFDLTGTDGLGNAVTVSATSNSEGRFTFDGLKPSVPGQGQGTGYTIEEDVPSTHRPTTPFSTVVTVHSGDVIVPVATPAPEDVVNANLQFGNMANHQPTADSQSRTTDEDQPIVVTLSGADNDPGAAQTLTFTIVSGPTHGTLGSINQATGQVTYTPAEDYNGSDSFTFTVTDDINAGGPALTSVAATVSLTINAVNDQPVANTQSATTAEDTAKILVLGNDDDSERTQTLTLNILTGPSHGTLTGFNATTGEVTYTPAGDYNGSDSFTFTLTDDSTAGGAALTSAEATVSITVTEVNDAPTANADTATVAEESSVTLDVRTNDSKGPANESGQSLTVTVATALHGTVTINADGTLTYEPNDDYNGSDTISYTITDNGATNGAADPLTSSSTVAVTVSEVNDAPTANADSTIVAEDGSVTLDVRTNDSKGPANESGQSLTVTVATALHGTVTINADGTLTYEPNDDYNGSDTISYTITDNGTTNGAANPLTSSSTVDVTVSEVNDAPTANADTATVAEENSVTLDVRTNDSKGPANESGQSLTVTVATALHGTVTINANGTLTYEPNDDYNGSDTISYTITDNGTTNGAAIPLTSSSTVAVVVTEVNDAPTGTDDELASVLEDSGKRIISFDTLLGNDSDGPLNEASQLLTITAVSNPVGGTVTINGSNVEFTVAANFNGIASFTYTLRDNGTTNALDDFLTDTTNVSFTVIAVNDVPSFTKGASQIVLEDAGAQTVTGWAMSLSKVPANESGQVLDFLISNDNAGLFAVAPNISADGTLTYTPAANANGSATVTVRIHDNGGGENDGVDTSAPQTFTITVTAVNDAPSFVMGPDMHESGDGTVKTVSHWATSISPGPANESTQTVSFTLVAVNTSLFTTQPAIDADGNLSFTPKIGAVGSTTVTVTARDTGNTDNGGDNDSVQTFMITLSGLNKAPSFVVPSPNPDVHTSLEDDGSQIVPGWVTDIHPGRATTVDGLDDADQNVTFLVTIPAANNTLFTADGRPAISADGTLTYTAAANANGSVLVTVIAQDDGGTANGGKNTSAAQTFTIKLTAVNDVPSFTLSRTQVDVLEDSVATTVAAFATNLVKGPTNEASQVLNFLVEAEDLTLFSTQPAISAAGVLTFKPALNAYGSTTITVQLHDNGGVANDGVDTSEPQTFTINITPVNDAPTFLIPKVAPTNHSNHTSLEDAGLQTVPDWVTAITAGPNDLDQTVDFIVTVPDASKPLFATLPAISADGELTYEAAPDAVGTVTVTVVAHDDGGTANLGKNTSAAQTFTITLTPVNDVPSFDLPVSEVVVLEDAVAQSRTGFATNLRKGPTNEATQTLSFLVTNDNNTLFATQPAISPLGVLTFKSALNAHGTATVSVRIKDNGGVSNDGVDTSEEQTFTIDITPVNDAPTFLIPKVAPVNHSNHTSLEDAGSQSVPNWVTAFTAGPNDVDQTVDFIVTVPAASQALFTSPPEISGDGTLTYEAAPDANGTVTVTVVAHDDGGTDNLGKNTSAAQTFTITLTPVNDVPSFELPVTAIELLEDALAQSRAGFATNLSKGAANETTQKLKFLVTNDNTTLFATPPAISDTGVLTFKPALNANGTATVTVQVQDNGLVANGGVDTSEPQTFTINVIPVNDAPSFLKGANQTGKEDDPAKTVLNWATKLAVGPVNELGQALDFLVTTNNDALFSELPEVSPEGTLTYRTAENAFGVATVTVRLHDDGGTVNNGVDMTPLPAQTFTITATADNDLPTITELDDLTIDEDTNTGALNFTIGDVEPGTLTPSKLSSNVKLVPLANIVFGGSGTDRTVTVTPAPNQFGSSTITIKVTDANGGVSQETFVLTVDPLNDGAPTISNIADVTITEKQSTAAIAFTVDDPDDKLVNGNSALVVTATSSDQTLIPDANIVLGGTAGNRTIKVTPVPNQFATTATATITVTVTDTGLPTLTAPDTFVVTVNPVNEAPVVTATSFQIEEYPEAGEGDLVVGTVTAIDPDLGDSITVWSIVAASNPGGIFAIDANGQITIAKPELIDFESLVGGAYKLSVSATDNNRGLGTTPKLVGTGIITVNVTDEFFELDVPLTADAANPVTIKKVGTALQVLRGTTNLIPVTRAEDIDVLTINGGSLADTLTLDTSLNVAATLANKFKGTIVFNGNDGNDVLTSNLITVSTFHVEFRGGAGADSANAGAEIDALFGGDGNDTFTAGVGDDLLEGGAGDDILNGGKGNDTYRFGDAATAEIDTVKEIASEGTADTLDFGEVSTAVTVKLTRDNPLVTHFNRTVKTAAAGQAAFFENAIGGDGNDILIGNAAANSLIGGAGDDVISGAGGKDTINGNAGADQLLGGAGQDSLVGGTENDILFGEADNDTLTGGEGADSLSGGLGSTNLTDFEAEIDMVGAFTDELNALLAALP